MKKTTAAIAAVLVIVIILGSYYGSTVLMSQPQSPAPTATPTAAPTAEPTAHPSSTSTPIPSSTTGATATPRVTARPAPTSTTPTEITYVDAKGDSVTLTYPLSSVASLNSGITELICALGSQDMLVGRSAGCVYPPSVASVQVIGDSSYTPNFELILQQQPQLLLADTMLYSKTETLQQIRDAGIPVIIEQPGNFSRLTDLVTFLGIILDNPAEATEINAFTNQYVTIVHDRVASLTEDQKPLVYFEMSRAWRSATADSVRNEYLVEAGGININADAAGSTVTPEFVASANPDVIVRMISSETFVESEFITVKDEIMSRSQISTTNAIINDEVYIYDSTIFTGLRYPIGLLYWAKWFNPDLFTDIDPAAVHEQLNQQFYGLPLPGVYTYP